MNKVQMRVYAFSTMPFEVPACDELLVTTRSPVAESTTNTSTRRDGYRFTRNPPFVAPSLVPCKKCQINVIKVDGFSSDTSPEFEDLMSNGILEEMEAEVWHTRLA